MDVVSAEQLLLHHPFSMLLSGSRRTGKTEFTKTLLLQSNDFITPRVNWIFWFAPTHQKELFQVLEEKLDNIIFCKGLPEDDILDYVHQRSGRKLIILDDLMEEASERKDILNLFTRGRHEDVSIILLSQNDFHAGKHYRTIARNTDYSVVFKNVRNPAMINIYAQQMHLKEFLPKAYQDAVKEPYGYLFMNLRSDCDDRLRFRTKIFSNHSITYIKKV